MELISSILKFLVPLLLTFFPVRIILNIVNEKFNIFTTLQKLIKKSGKEKLINNFVFIISIALFLLISNYININDFEFGIVAGVFYGIVFTILPMQWNLGNIKNREANSLQFIVILDILMTHRIVNINTLKEASNWFFN